MTKQLLIASFLSVGMLFSSSSKSMAAEQDDTRGVTATITVNSFKVVQKTATNVLDMMYDNNHFIAPLVYEQDGTWDFVANLTNNTNASITGTLVIDDYWNLLEGQFGWDYAGFAETFPKTNPKDLFTLAAGETKDVSLSFETTMLPASNRRFVIRGYATGTDYTDTLGVNVNCPNDKYLKYGTEDEYYYSNGSAFMTLYSDRYVNRIDLVACDEQGFSVGTGKGAIAVKADKNIHISVNNATGICVADLDLEAGESKTLTVPQGVYIVGGQKVLVK